MNLKVAKMKGINAERKVVEFLSNLGYKVWRVPMSLLPFDILAVDVEDKEIRFVEVKTLKSKLSPRQLWFAKLIEQLDIPSINFNIAVVTEEGKVLFCYCPTEECRYCGFNEVCKIYKLKREK